MHGIFMRVYFSKEGGQPTVTLTQLSISNMESRHPGLTQAIANNYSEAASICLDRHHISPVGFTVQNANDPVSVMVNWKEVDMRMRNAWANESDATRDGAYACALAAVELAVNMVAIRRAETLTGADYYIGKLGEPAEEMEGLQRLEVSGVDKGDGSVIAHRLREKMDQAAMGQSNLPAMACVVGFRATRIVMQYVGAT